VNPAAPPGARALAPCKINPTLFALARRPDGFHELALTYAALELGDTLELRPAAPAEPAEPTGKSLGSAVEDRLELSGPAATPDVPRGATNLALRAARAVLDLAREGGRPSLPTSLVLGLEKRVPSQAGLGGGSSDAAAAAWLACRLTGLSPEDPRVREALASLGSDNLFFLGARATGHARGRGRGDEIEPLPTPRLRSFALVIAPSAGAPTAAVYAELASRGIAGDPATLRARALAAESAWCEARTVDQQRASQWNDLEAPALAAVPALAPWRAFLDRRGAAHFRLAGSGSAFFGWFESRGEAQATLDVLLGEARSAGLVARGAWVARLAGHGVRSLE